MAFDDKLAPVFSNVLTEIITTVSGFYLDVISEEKDILFDEMIGIMSLCGKPNPMIFISTNEKDMRILCSFITGVPQDEVTKSDMEDAICELVNMTAGSAKLRLSGSDYTFNLAPPFVINGKDMSITVKNKTRIFSKILSNGEITVRIKVIY